ncbi:MULTISPECIES: hypothetical protein [Thermoactinomyces]|uniref:Uncharacterized protein n=1 Tax=Thermoactinomyces daqus TaxID=1329516 RepID=A0A7W1XCB9_9BACL|nr:MULTISPECIES: hypothetical protein [Thermoactinomyces]MBA4543968.1 hypothetical protein [Thermoactinomyces daqus]MBH8599098.1 hypothetical protein [Thermoactinomyces sp. CICC 10523]MBH8607970.1 hypothetical protein [Thermoactinomyces sp. CICC 10521]
MKKNKDRIVFQAVVNKPVDHLREGDPIVCAQKQMDTIASIFTVNGRTVIKTKNFGCYFAEDLVVRL